MQGRSFKGIATKRSLRGAVWGVHLVIDGFISPMQGSPLRLALCTLSSRNCYELLNTAFQLALWATKNCATYMFNKLRIFFPFRCEKYIFQVY